MPFAPMPGTSTTFFTIILLVGFVFVGILFALLGIELKWRLRGVLLLIVLVIGSSGFGIAGTMVMESVSYGEFMPNKVELENISDQAGFNVYIPKKLPNGMKLKEASVFPMPPDFNEATLVYSGGGARITIMESTGMGMGEIDPPMMGEEFFGDAERTRVQIKGQPGYIVEDEAGFTFLSTQLDEVSITITSSLGTDETIKIAKSLQKQTK